MTTTDSDFSVLTSDEVRSLVVGGAILVAVFALGYLAGMHRVTIEVSGFGY